MSEPSSTEREALRRYPTDFRTIGGSAAKRAAFVAGVEWQRAADAEEIERLRSDRLVAGRGLNGAAEELRLACVENAELAQQIAAVQAYGEKMRAANGMSWCSMHGRDLLAILSAEPTEHICDTECYEDQHGVEHHHDDSAGDEFEFPVTPESETN